ncbi:MAG: glutamine synthetase [Gammaproteobacteria bacterium]|nr:glutamine synthetase family protein [Gammaproteobacteria bacterium]NNM01172.1 glutamine synthetase [Gammaproteobacteria bacterium]
MTSPSFVERHELWSAEQADAAAAIRQRLEAGSIRTVRLAFADQHGLLRGKTLVTRAFLGSFETGCRITTTLLLKDTSHRTAFPIWRAGGGLGMDTMTGAADFIMVPDPLTFRILPWAEDTAWLLCDCYFDDGTQVPFSTRALCARVLDDLADGGFDLLTGMELEFSVYRIEDARLEHEHCGQPGAPPRVKPLAHGFQYLTEHRYDEFAPLLDQLHDTLTALDLPLRTMESEFGPNQVELTFDPVAGLANADNLVLTRSAIKQTCRRLGYLATFMCRPGLPNAFSAGWHLHQSLSARDSGANAFATVGPEARAGSQPGELLSDTGRAYLAGLLAHAGAACIFSTPTINGYKRYRPFTLAPNQVVWSRDNRGAMLRVIGPPGDPATHIENRAGEPAANPYLYLASQAVCGMDGLAQGLAPPAPVDDPYEPGYERLPRNLYEAVNLARQSTLFQSTFGPQFMDYYLAIKEFELHRFLSEEVTDWEHNEYFENF